MKCIDGGVCGPVTPAEGSKVAYVINEEELQKALEKERSPIVLRESFDFATPVILTYPNLIITSDCCATLTFVGAAGGAVQKAIQIAADDITLSDFKLTSTMDLLGSQLLFGITFANDSLSGHRTRLLRLEVYNWQRCLSKDGGVGPATLDDVLVEDSYFHSFSGYGVLLCFGLMRLTMRRDRVRGKLSGATHTSENGVTCGVNTTDCLFEDLDISFCGRMGFESTIADYVGSPTSFNIRPKVIRMKVSDCGHFGMSLGSAQDFLIDSPVIKNVVGLGIEMASLPDNLCFGQCVNPLIDGVSGTSATGFILNAARDSVVIGGKVSNIASAPTTSNASGGIVTNSQRCSVIGVEFNNAGFWMLYFLKGIGANNVGFHHAHGNRFRHTVYYTNQRAIYVFDTMLTAYDNKAYMKAGHTLNFEVNCVAGAGVYDSCSALVLVGGFGIPDIGATVSQGTSKSTPVVLNKAWGTITMHPAALPDATTVTFTVTNSLCELGDSASANHASAGTGGAYQVQAHSFAAGSFKISVRNTSGGPLSEAIVLSFSLAGKTSTNQAINVP